MFVRMSEFFVFKASALFKVAFWDFFLSVCVDNIINTLVTKDFRGDKDPLYARTLARSDFVKMCPLQDY